MKTHKQPQTKVVVEVGLRETSVHEAGIGVEVKDGIVTLAGHGNSCTARRSAERADSVATH